MKCMFTDLVYSWMACKRTSNKCYHQPSCCQYTSVILDNTSGLKLNMHSNMVKCLIDTFSETCIYRLNNLRDYMVYNKFVNILYVCKTILH